MFVRAGSRSVALFAVFLLTGCRSAQSSVTPAPASAPAGYEIEAVSPPRGTGARVLIYHDMEGLSGQDDWRTWSVVFPERYKIGQELLVADVNAVVEGLFAAGASRVDVVDAHGSGNPDPDIPLGRLDRRANQLSRDKPFRPYVDIVEAGVYDAIVAVGMHAKTGSGGFSSHTISFGTAVIFNGKAVTETELIAFSWGRVGVPVIFASGDDRLRADLAAMPWIEYVEVKRALSASEAQLRPVAEARAELSASAKRALERLGMMKTMRLTTPVRAALRVTPPAGLSVLEGVPGVQYHDNTVEFTAPDFISAHDGIRALINVAARSYSNLLFESLGGRADNASIMTGFAAALVARWLDVESGRWPPPATSASQTPPAPAAPRKYFGAP